MKSVLYIVSKSAESWPDYQFILNQGDKKEHKTVVLLEHHGIEEGLSVDQIFKLEENEYDSVHKNTIHSSAITYRELLDLIFSSDHSVVV